jgi:hypothetical protein
LRYKFFYYEYQYDYNYFKRYYHYHGCRDYGAGSSMTCSCIQANAAIH